MSVWLSCAKSAAYMNGRKRKRTETAHVETVENAQRQSMCISRCLKPRLGGCSVVSGGRYDSCDLASNSFPGHSNIVGVALQASASYRPVWSLIANLGRLDGQVRTARDSVIWADERLFLGIRERLGVPSGSCFCRCDPHNAGEMGQRHSAMEGARFPGENRPNRLSRCKRHPSLRLFLILLVRPVKIYFRLRRSSVSQIYLHPENTCN